MYVSYNASSGAIHRRHLCPYCPIQITITGFYDRLDSQSYTYENLEEIAAYLTSKHPSKCQLGIICGTGLGGLADLMENTVSVDYADIPNFPVSTGR